MRFRVVVTVNGEKLAEAVAREQDAHSVGSQLQWSVLGLYRNAQGVLENPPEIVVTTTPIPEGKAG